MRFASFSDSDDLTLSGRQSTDDSVATLQDANLQEPEPNETGGSQPIAQNMDIAAGRVTTLDTGLENVASIEITELPEIGNLTVNPDNTLALVLTSTDYSGPLSFQYDATFSDGTSQSFDYTVDVQPLTTLKGWSTGESVYMLETDDEGDLVIEHGDIHRTVHVSGSDSALSRAELAEIYDLDENDINANWLLQHPEYGATPDLELDQELGKELWQALNKEPGSHWLLLERGYEYDNVDLFPKGMQVESELHPTYVGAYGEGSAPRIVGKDIRNFHGQDNVVVEDLEFAADIRILGESENWIFNNIIMDRHELALEGWGNHLNGFTVRNSVLYGSVEDAPEGENWGNTDRVQGIFATKIDGFLLENIVVDHSGWEAGYEYDGDGDFGQAPSKMSHNIYMTNDLSDITMRDSIIMRGASYGVQFRSGGFVEDNAFIDNNAAFYTSAAGGDGHFSLVTDNLVTSGAAKESVVSAALTFGIGNWDHDTLLDNIVTHLADPNNPDEFAAKVGNGTATGRPENYYDDTIVYNWIAQNYLGNPTALERNADQNVDGLDTDLADQTTIQNFTADLLGQSTATIDDLGQYLRTQIEDDQLDPVTADEIIAYFQETFGIAPDVRFSEETLRFVPNDLGDGVRWDNRINWSTEDLPGTVEGDSVDLAGNWVIFATTNATVQDLDFGSGGRLAVTSGRLDVEGETSVGANGGEIDVSGAGQIWMNAYSDEDALDIDVDGGRFANTGVFEGLLDLHVTDGQALLGVDDAVMELGQDSSLTVVGDDAKVGFDGEAGGVSVLRMESGSALRMVAGEDGFSTIGEFRSGAHENDDPDVLSALDIGEGALLIDVAEIAGGAARDDILIDTDEIAGMFDNVEFIGLGSDQDATLVVDYDTDTVTLSLGEAGEGTGAMDVATVGNMLNAADSAEIWAVLTEGQGTYEELDASTPDAIPGEQEDFEDAMV